MKKQVNIHQNRYPKILLIIWALLLLGGCTLQEEKLEPVGSACNRPYVSVPGKIMYTSYPLQTIRVLESRTVSEILPKEADTYRAGPRWSPDGNYIAYMKYIEQHHENGPVNYGVSISIIHPNGGSYKELAIEKPYSSPYDYSGYTDLAWSPDGSQIAYLHPEGTSFSVRIARIVEGVETTLTTLEGFPLAFDWSPDGSKFVLSIQNPGDNTNKYTYRIIMIDQQGNLVQQKDCQYSIAYSLRWSPDGSNILLSYDDHEHLFDGQTIHIMNASLSGLRCVTKDASIAAWSPDGKQIVCLKAVMTEFGWGFVASDYCYYLCTMDLNGNEKEKISPKMDRIVRDLDWTGS